MAIKKNTQQDIETTDQTFMADLLDAIDSGIKHIASTHNIEVQKMRYKAMRAIAYQAFSESFAAGDFDALVERASANADNLPRDWALDAERAKTAPVPARKLVEKPVEKKPAPKPAASKTPAKTPAKAPAKTSTAVKPATTRRRPARKPAAPKAGE